MDIMKTTHAIRQLKKLPVAVRQEINDAINELADWPHVDKVKALSGRNDYRLRVGRYRVIFEVTQSVIWITQVLIRDDTTY